MFTVWVVVFRKLTKILYRDKDITDRHFIERHNTSRRHIVKRIASRSVIERSDLCCCFVLYLLGVHKTSLRVTRGLPASLSERYEAATNWVKVERPLTFTNGTNDLDAVRSPV